jgi:hypothetical protein
MLQTIPDPFDSYGPPQRSDQIFSILTPLSLSSTCTSPSASPVIGTPYSEGHGHYFEHYSPLESQTTAHSAVNPVTGQWTSSPNSGSLIELPPVPGSASPSASQIQYATRSSLTTTPLTNDEDRAILQPSSHGLPSPLEQILHLPHQESSAKAVKGTRKALGRTALDSSLLVNTARSRTHFPSETIAGDDDEDRGQATPRFSTFSSRNTSSLSRIETSASS